MLPRAIFPFSDLNEGFHESIKINSGHVDKFRDCIFELLDNMLLIG